jgi:hypothetical protein
MKPSSGCNLKGALICLINFILYNKVQLDYIYICICILLITLKPTVASTEIPPSVLHLVVLSELQLTVWDRKLCAYGDEQEQWHCASGLIELLAIKWQR